MKLFPNKNYRVIAYYDWHSPHNINPDPVLNFQESFDPNIIVLGGDFMNLEACSHWNEALFKEIGFGKLRKNLRHELAAGKKLLEKIRLASPNARIFYIPGNHEHHLFWAAQYYPQLHIDTHIDMDDIHYKSDLAEAGNQAIADILKDALDARILEVEILAYNEELKIGLNTFLHGHQVSISNCAKLYPNKNVIFGHYHTQTCNTLNDSGDGEVVQHISVPCLTPLGPQKPGYLRSKSTRWLNGFWIADVLANGLFDGRVKKVLGGNILIP